MKECNRLSFHEELYMKELNSPRHEVLGGVVLLTHGCQKWHNNNTPGTAASNLRY